VFWLNKPDTFIRGNNRQLLECCYGPKCSYTQYPKGFKEEAVALIRDQGYSVADVGKSLGITTSLLYRWKDQQEQESAGNTLSGDVHAALQRLRKESKELRMEREIEPTSAFFAKEMK
jgi:transposase